MSRLASAVAWRDQALAKEFEQIDAEVRAAGMRLGKVVWVKEYYPRKGTKAQLEWLDTGESTAVWIDHRLLNTMDIVAASGNRGWGPHHDEEVFFIGRCAGHFISRRTYKGWRRHHARLVRAATGVRT
jgi:hypothetical protein